MPKDQETAILRSGFVARCGGPFKEETQAAKSESRDRARLPTGDKEGQASPKEQLTLV